MSELNEPGFENCSISSCASDSGKLIHFLYVSRLFETSFVNSSRSVFVSSSTLLYRPRTRQNISCLWMGPRTGRTQTWQSKNIYAMSYMDTALINMNASSINIDTSLINLDTSLISTDASITWPSLLINTDPSNYIDIPIIQTPL